MTRHASRELLGRVLRRILAVPIYVKILGIGLMVTMLFGIVTFYQIRVGVLRTYYLVHGETAIAVANSLAGRLAPLIRANDIPSVDQEVHQTIISFPDVRYVVVQDSAGQIISHGFTFPEEVPPDIAEAPQDLCAACHPALPAQDVPRSLMKARPDWDLLAGHLRAYSRPSGLILEATEPLGATGLGTIRLGVGDRTVTRVIESITFSLVWSLILCALVGLSLALALAYAIVKPIHELVRATDAIHQGDFASRAPLLAEDEIGQLAESFNQMAEGLESYREQVQVKEAARVSLIGRIVRAQEDERKALARELHDRLGQSLSKTLLTIESSCKECRARSESCHMVRGEIRGLIDEVRQLAWDTRPSVLDDYGLDSALGRYVEEMRRRVDFEIDYQCVAPHDAARLPAEVEVTLYRIAQEAVTNIIRHAKATQVSVILIRNAAEVSLLVEDNGQGFDMGAVEKKACASLGLMGMQERAALVGGEFAVYSHPGEGATVRVRVSLNGA